MWAAAGGHLTVVEGLISRGAAVNAVTARGKTALLLAAQCGRGGVCQCLLSHGAAIAHQDEDGQTALFGAVEAGNSELLESLVEGRCSLEACACSGVSVLMWAARVQEVDCARVLLRCRAQVHRRNEDGLKAIHYAETALNSELVELLRAAGGGASPEPEEPN
mmetsp:Transcript_83977/g.261160  ORF Transcript_83977/g.261160 Transcript_83977/m.261160 type:complete len:163 (+) Transcript_83977:2-490(+)